MIVLTRLTSIDYQLGLTGDPGQPVNPGGQFDFSVGFIKPLGVINPLAYG